MGAYNPATYHNGSVWPHDSALVMGGLMRYGFTEQAQAIACVLLEAADYFGDDGSSCSAAWTRRATRYRFRTQPHVPLRHGRQRLLCI